MIQTDPAVLPPTDDPYSDYHAWKGWEALFTLNPEQAGYFAGELSDLKIAGAKVLEIGFGSGSCLAWMKQRGAELYGCEISDTSRAAALEYGVTTIPADLPRIAKDYADRFDTIIAFDVFEHLSIDEVRAYLAACETMLRKGGKLLLRFPNAQSPFGLQPQMGDPTHRSTLSRSAIELLISGRALSVTRYGPSFHFTGKSCTKWLARSARFAAQRAITLILNFVYATNIPYEPVVVLVLRKE
jgi:SAM-dependent methyltransferase